MLPIGVVTRHSIPPVLCGRLHQTDSLYFLPLTRRMELFGSLFFTNQAPANPMSVLYTRHILTTQVCQTTSMLQNHLHTPLLDHSSRLHLTSVPTHRQTGSLGQITILISLSIVYYTGILLVHLAANVLLVRSSTTGYGSMKKNSSKV